MRKGSGKDGKPKQPRPAIDRRQIDRLHEALSRALTGQDFNSTEEANRFLQQKLAAGAFAWDALGPGPDATPLARAQDLFYEALEAPSRGKRVKMARQALAISEDCADAWLLLAEEEALTAAERKMYATKALAAAERALGPKTFEECRGHFWGFHETRPYMRARQALAGLLAESGKQEEAIAHWEAMLELNPGDNQGIRMQLLRAYLERGEQEKICSLFRQYPDDGSCEMMYGQVLHDLARGDEKAARKSLAKARKINPHLPQFLLGRRPLPKKMPELVTWGGEDEAGVYALAYFELWRKTAGALDLLSGS